MTQEERGAPLAHQSRSRLGSATTDRQARREHERPELLNKKCAMPDKERHSAGRKAPQWSPLGAVERVERASGELSALDWDWDCDALATAEDLLCESARAKVWRTGPQTTGRANSWHWARASLQWLAAN